MSLSWYELYIVVNGVALFYFIEYFVVFVQMEGIGNIRDDMRRHFRTKLKNIFTKFIRKFG